MKSIWLQDTTIKEHEKLNGDLSVDAVVIGAGLSGILTAFYLQNQGVSVVVLEASRIGSGQTKNTTAKITSQHGLIYSDLINKFGREKAKQYADANHSAVVEYKNLIDKLHIECDFEQIPNYIYSTSEEERLIDEARAAESLGLEAKFTKSTSLPFEVSGAVRFDHQAQFHPLKFIKAISDTLTIYENTQAKEIIDNTVFTDYGKVMAKHIVIATHYPYINAPGYYFLRMHQERSYLISLDNAQKVDGMYLGIDSDGLSFRNSGNTLLLGGGGHRTGEENPGGKYEFLRSSAKRYYPDSNETAYWSAQDCVSIDRVPYIGQYSASTPNLYVATGFKKWGMSSSMVSALILSGMITGKTPDYAEIFSPQRFNVPASAKTLLEDGLTAVGKLASQFLVPPKETLQSIANGEGGIINYNGEKVGVYKDEHGEIFLVSTKCAHLGCQLSWNPNEKSWDCPCHGSRFDYKGNLIDNPATKGIKDE